MIVGYFYVSSVEFTDFSLINRFNIIPTLISGSIVVPLIPEFLEHLKVGNIKKIRQLSVNLFILVFVISISYN
jgi:O-antigen/teichoic acid export membrane protein